MICFRLSLPHEELAGAGEIEVAEVGGVDDVDMRAERVLGAVEVEMAVGVMLF